MLLYFLAHLISTSYIYQFPIVIQDAPRGLQRLTPPSSQPEPRHHESLTGPTTKASSGNADDGDDVDIINTVGDSDNSTSPNQVVFMPDYGDLFFDMEGYPNYDPEFDDPKIIPNSNNTNTATKSAAICDITSNSDVNDVKETGHDQSQNAATASSPVNPVPRSVETEDQGVTDDLKKLTLSVQTAMTRLAHDDTTSSSSSSSSASTGAAPVSSITATTSSTTTKMKGLEYLFGVVRRAPLLPHSPSITTSVSPDPQSSSSSSVSCPPSSTSEPESTFPWGSVSRVGALKDTVFTEWWAHNTKEEKAAFGMYDSSIPLLTVIMISLLLAFFFYDYAHVYYCYNFYCYISVAS